MSYITISASVGQGGANRSSDVLAIQVMLNHFIRNHWLGGHKKLAEDGFWGPKTRGALKDFMAISGVLDEFSTGVAKPKGSTISFMNKTAGNFSGPVGGSSSPKPAKQRTGQDLVDEVIEKLKSDGGLSKEGERLWRRNVAAMLKSNFGTSDLKSTIDSISNVHNFVDLVLDGAALWRASGSYVGVGAGISRLAGASSAVGTVLGFIGPFLQFYGFIKALDHIALHGARVNKGVGMAFGVTQFIFNDRCPEYSKDVVREWRKEEDYLKSDWPDMAKAWREGVFLGLRGMRIGVKREGEKAGMGYGHAQDVARGILRPHGKTTLTRAALVPIAQRYEKAGQVNEASKLFDWAGRITYP